MNIGDTASLLEVLGIVFSAGFLSGLSPCSLPTVVLVVGYVSAKKTETHLHAFLLSLAFVGGIIFTLASLGALSGLLGELARSKVFNYALIFVIVLIALWMLGLFNLHIGAHPDHWKPKKGSDALGAFLLGLPFGVAASPCTLPVTLAVLVYAARMGDVCYGVLLLAVFALGRSVPLLMAGTFTGFLKKMQKFAKYQLYIERGGGVLLLGLALYLLLRL